MNPKAWAVDTGVRAVKTFAQTLVALFGADAFNVLKGVDWKTDLGIAAGAGLVSVLHNVQSFGGPAASDVPVAAVVAAVPAAEVAPVAPVVPEFTAALPSTLGPSSP